MTERIEIIEEVTVVEVDETHVEIIEVAVQGPAGAPGADGAPGPQGLPGIPGPAGDPATNLVTSVAGKQGTVTLSKGDVGLSAVDNTPDTAKPVSTAQQVVLDAKMDFPTANSRVPVRGDTANQASLPYATGPLGTSFPLRTGVGTLKGATAIASDDLVPKAQLDAGLALQVSKAGDTMTGALAVATESLGFTSTRAGTSHRFGNIGTGDFTVYQGTAGTTQMGLLHG